MPPYKDIRGGDWHAAAAATHHGKEVGLAKKVGQPSIRQLAARNSIMSFFFGDGKDTSATKHATRAAAFNGNGHGDTAVEREQTAILAEHGAIVLGNEALHLRHIDIWSGHHCVGDVDTDLMAHERKVPRPFFPLTRACVFSSICWAPLTGKWLYHESNRSRLDITDKIFVATSSAGTRRGDALALKVVHRQLDSSSRELAMIPGLTALMGERFAPNVGHFIWDNAFALLTSMSQLGVYTSELNVLRTSSCMATKTASFARAFCDELAEAFLSPLNGRSPTAPSRGWVRTLDQLRAAYPSSKRICFKQLQAGGVFNAFDSEPLNSGREGLFALYRHRVLQWHGLNSFATRPAAPPRILLVRKSSKRAEGARRKRDITNFQGVNEHMRSRFGNHADVRVTSFAGMPFAEQLQLITSTSVAFSPCGGISMLLPFLPRGAHVVLINYIIRTLDPRYVGVHGECANCSWTMESELWRHVRHVHPLFYRIEDASDVPVPFLTKAAGGLYNTNPDGYHPQRDASVHVDLRRLESLIQSALTEQAAAAVPPSTQLPSVATPPAPSAHTPMVMLPIMLTHSSKPAHVGRNTAMIDQLARQALPVSPVSVDHLELKVTNRSNMLKAHWAAQHASGKARLSARNVLLALERCMEPSFAWASSCVVIEDDTRIHPYFAAEVAATLAQLPASWQLIHLCPAFLWIGKGKRFAMEAAGEAAYRLQPGPNVLVGSSPRRDQSRVFLKYPPPFWVKGEKGEPIPPTSHALGGPTAFLVRRAHVPKLARQLAHHIEHLRDDIGISIDTLFRNQLFVPGQHFIARDPQLCREAMHKGTKGGPGASTSWFA